MQETPWIKFKAGKEFQAITADRLEWLYYCCLGPDEPAVRQTDRFVRKGVFTWLRNSAFSVFRKITERKKPSTPRPKVDIANNTIPKSDIKKMDNWLGEYLETDWNPVYEELKDTGTLLGALSSYLTGNYNLPVSKVQEMGIEDYDKALRYREGYGFERIDDLYPKLDIDRSVQYAKEYAKRESAVNLAVYNEHGQRAGRAYEIVTEAFRKQISEALEQGKTVAEIRSKIAYPDLREYLESGKISVDEYNEWMQDHMNRDFQRIAVTEASYAFNYGRMKHLAESDRTYLRFMPG